MTKPLRACMLVIADEVLSGKILDTNSHHLAKLAFNHGIQLSKISVIPDCEETIAAEVLDASNSYDYVFTSGGIGPTHDDKTFASLSRAFKYPLTVHAETLDRMTHYFTSKGQSMNAGRMKMFTPAPQSTPMNASIWCPVLTINKVTVFPGVSWLFQSLSTSYFHEKFQGRLRRTRILVAVEMSESDLAPILNECLMDLVSVGSYPAQTHVVISVESDSLELAEACRDNLLSRVHGRVINVTDWAALRTK